MLHKGSYSSQFNRVSEVRDVGKADETHCSLVIGWGYRPDEMDPWRGALIFFLYHNFSMSPLVVSTNLARFPGRFLGGGCWSQSEGSYGAVRTAVRPEH